MPQVFATEPVMHDGQVYLPGQTITGDVNEIASIIGAGRGTQDADAAKIAKKQYDASQKAAAATPATDPSAVV
jgi:hypothetical protein